MNKAELIAQIAEDAGVTKTQANAALDSFVDTGTKALKKGDKVTPVGFGTFSVSKRAAQSLRRATGRFPLLLYLGAIASITVIIAGILLAQALGAGMPAGVSDPALLATDLLSLLAASQLAVALVNWLATLLVTPQPLPKMDFSEGISPNSRTLVVVPTMLTSAPGVEDLVEALEVRFLANRDECLHFGLLTDLRDAKHESLAEDEPPVRLVQLRNEELNEKYRDGGGKAKGDCAASGSECSGIGSWRGPARPAPSGPERPRPRLGSTLVEGPIPEPPPRGFSVPRDRP